MRKNYFLLGLALFAGLSAKAAVADSLAFWDFEGKMVDGVMDSYAYYVDDEIGGVSNAWVIPNAGNVSNKSQAKFSAYHEGIDVNSVPISYYQGVSRGTTTTFGGYCLAAQNWDNADVRKVRYWYLENVSTLGFDQIKVQLYLTSAGTGGPSKFRFGYKIGNGPWIDEADFKDVRTGVSTSSYIGTNPLDLWVHNLPAACANQAKISCRWTSNDSRLDGTAISTSSYSRLDNVFVSGVQTTGIAPANAEQSLKLSGNQIFANAETTVEVYNLQGIRIQEIHLMAGESKEMEKGFYILKTPKESLKFLVK